jgi:hypothetical protein
MKELKKHYWIPTTTWNLSDVFATESISPFLFYTRRLFGSKSNQIADDKGKLIEANNSIILYPKIFSFTPSIGKPAFILVNCNSLDSNFLEVDNNEIAYYRKTIYFKRGNFQVRFQNEEDKNIFLATLSINLETKTLKKYNVEFNFSSNKQNILHIHSPSDIFNFNPDTKLSEIANEEQLYFDKTFNQIKGLIYGLVCSTIGKKTSVQITLEKNLQNLKNKISGFRTRLELSELFNSEMISSLINNVKEVEEIFSVVFPETSSAVFQSINQRLSEIGTLQTLRLATLTTQRQKFAAIDKSVIQKLKDSLQVLQDDDFKLKSKEEKLWEQRRIFDAEYKSIKRPKKNSTEYEQKNSLKEKITELKEAIQKMKDERRSGKTEIQKYKSELAEYSEFGRTQYDSNIEEQFYKISGYINDLIFSTNDKIIQSQQSQKKYPDLSQIKFDIQSLINTFNGNKHNDFVISLQSELFDFASEEEKYLFKEILEVILLEANFSTEVSETSITNIAENVFRNFSESKFSVTEIGKEILSHLQNLASYRTNKEMNYTFPNSIPVLQNFISFIIKPYNNDELKNFAYSKEVKDIHFGFSMWAGYIGFANLPKTFTDIVLESGDDQLIEYIDDYLFDTYLNENKIVHI